MKYALLADIHANLKALETVLEDARTHHCTHLACLGDLVGYNRQPKECVDAIRRLGIPCVKGNFDEYCCMETHPEGLNPKALEYIQWTHDQLTEDDRAWMRALPYVEVLHGFSIVHSSLNEPRRWAYVFDRVSARFQFDHQTTPVCFFGHTHVPVVFVRDTTVRGGSYTKFKIEPNRQYFVNVGSVGHPRDGQRKATYAIYDLDGQTIELRRLEVP
ncbi:MAG: metallophosphoesterase family protein [Verrucomicrobia bacterium]|nr:metallophosphoesterase family protein [Verrucomicrobiota bacterium]